MRLKKIYIKIIEIVMKIIEKTPLNLKNPHRATVRVYHQIRDLTQFGAEDALTN